MGVVVGVLVPDALESWVKFMAPVFAHSVVNVGQEDKSELGVVDGKAIGLHSPSFRSKEFHVGAYLLRKSKEKQMMARRCERTSAVFGQCAPWTTVAMTSSSCQSSMLLKSEPSAVQRMVSVTSEPTLAVMASAVPSLAPITAWLMRSRRSASSCASERLSRAGAMVTAHAGGRGDCCHVSGLIKHGRGGGNGHGRDVCDGIRSDAELDHAVSGVAGVVGLVESAPDSGDKCGGVFIVVLATSVGRKQEFCNACTYMFMSGGPCHEAGVGHG